MTSERKKKTAASQDKQSNPTAFPAWVPPVPQKTDAADAPEAKLMKSALEIYDKQFIADFLNRISPGIWSKEIITKWMSGKAAPRMSLSEYDYLKKLLPQPTVIPETAEFRFIDLFAGIGGIRKGFEAEGGLCVFTSEWDKEAIRTYKANYACDTPWHHFYKDIRDVTWSSRTDVTPEEVDQHIRECIPDHEVLLAGFPCQPFSIAGVSKKNSLGRKTGFEDKAQGTLFLSMSDFPCKWVSLKNSKRNTYGTQTFQA